MFDWEDLHYFVVFAQSKSLSAAARELGVDHATVARRIAALERSLSLKLVDRRPRSYVLTLDGERVAGLGDKMREEAYALTRLARAGQQALAGEVSISMPPSIANTFVVPLLIKLRAQHPAIHIRLIAETRLASLSHGEADIAVRLIRPTDEGLVARKVATFLFSLYASPEYLASVKPEDYVFIAFDGSMEASEQQRWLKDKAAGRDIVFRSNIVEIQRIAASAGVGVVMLPHYLAERNNLVKVCDDGLVRELWLAVHNDLHHTPVVRAVMDFLIGCFSEENV